MVKQKAVKIFSLKNLTNRPNVMRILLVRILVSFDHNYQKL